MHKKVILYVSYYVIMLLPKKQIISPQFLNYKMCNLTFKMLFSISYYFQWTAARVYLFICFHVLV